MAVAVVVGDSIIVLTGDATIRRGIEGIAAVRRSSIGQAGTGAAGALHVAGEASLHGVVGDVVRTHRPHPRP